MLKIFKKIIFSIVLLYIIAYSSVVLFTDNPIKCYIISLISPNKKYNYSKKVQVIDYIQLDSLMTKSPNTIFNFVSIYCHFSFDEIVSGLKFNEKFNKKILYISLDNSPSIPELSYIVANNSKISKIYIVDDISLPGSVYGRKRKVFDKYAPFYKEKLFTPMQMHSDTHSKINLITLGQEMRLPE